nr:glycoside hydrolase family 43 protein [Actinomycetota bacterium]
MRRCIPRSLGLLVVLLAATLAAPPAAAYIGAPWFRPGQPYSSNFPDPSVVRDGSTYVAFGTSTGGAYLPAMTSTDLETWTARPAYPQPACVGGTVDRFFNDAFPCPPGWGQDRPVGGRLKKELWAPGAVHIGSRWIVYYSMRVSTSPDRFCIGRAVSDSGPLGPYVDTSSAPFQCDDDPAGSIDPQPFVDDDGSAYLIWKSEGVVGSQPTRIWSRRLTADGLAFAPGSTPVELLRTSAPWEGNVIENPSMVRAGGRLLLFYSGNEWASPHYAIGYAACQGPQGPCTKSTRNPIHA